MLFLLVEDDLLELQDPSLRPSTVSSRPVSFTISSCVLPMPPAVSDDFFFRKGWIWLLFPAFSLSDSRL
jgi:hypothetical protein